MQNTTTPLLKSLRAVVQKQGTDLRKPEIAVLEKLELGRGGLWYVAYSINTGFLNLKE